MLLEYRESHGLSQREMAKLLGVSVPAYSLYENRKREMTFDTLIKFLKIRNWIYDELFIETLESIKKAI